MNFKATSKVRGDETQSFDVTDYKATTVGEFVDEVLLGNGKKEWGYFEFISVKPQKVGKWNVPPEWDRYEYKRGSLLDKIPDTLLNKRIERVTGDGGWSRMDYDITVAEENEKENEYCKQHCKGFQDTGGKCFVDDCRENEQYAVVRAKAKEICHCGVDCPNFEWCDDWCERLEQMLQMHEWTLKQITERASKWIDNNINYNTDDKVSRTKKEILRESLLKTVQL